MNASRHVPRALSGHWRRQRDFAKVEVIDAKKGVLVWREVIGGAVGIMAEESFRREHYWIGKTS